MHGGDSSGVSLADFILDYPSITACPLDSWLAVSTRSSRLRHVVGAAPVRAVHSHLGFCAPTSVQKAESNTWVCRNMEVPQNCWASLLHNPKTGTPKQRQTNPHSFNSVRPSLNQHKPAWSCSKGQTRSCNSAQMRPWNSSPPPPPYPLAISLCGQTNQGSAICPLCIARAQKSWQEGNRACVSPEFSRAVCCLVSRQSLKAQAQNNGQKRISAC